MIMTNRIIIKEGYLKKHTSKYDGFSIHHPMEKRWVVLQRNSLICYKSKQKNDITHSIELNQIKDVIKSKNDEIGQFEVIREQIKSKTNLIFAADNEHQMDEWINYIKNAAKLIKNNTYIHKMCFSEHSIKKAATPRQRRSLTAPTKNEENKHLKQKNKSLQQTVTKLKQRITELLAQIGGFKEQLRSNVSTEKYNIIIDRVQSINDEHTEMKRGDSKKLGVFSDDDDDDDDNRDDNKYRNWKRRKTINGKKNKRKLLASPPTSATTSPASSDNEFENDMLSLGGNALEPNNVNLLEGNVCDIFNRYKSVPENKLIKMLMKEDILFDSKMKVYSSSNDTYIDTAGILTKNDLYLISGINYQIWTQFKNRSKIDQLINDENDCDMKIDKDKANKLVNNLDIIDDHKINSSIESTFVGKTKKEIKLSILLNKTPIKSLSHLFLELNEIYDNEVSRFQQLKDVNCIMIKNFYNTDFIKDNERDTFLENVFDGIPWIDQEKLNNSIIITLKKYYTHSLISLINKRKNKYLLSNKVFDNKRIKIEAYTDKIKYSQCETNVAHIKSFNGLDLLGSVDNIGFEFVLQNNSNEHNDNIKCLVDSNNLCQEWMTHLDYVMFDKSKLNDNKEEKRESSSSTKEKLMNDFTDDDAHFGFGVYLNYWQHGYENTVEPKYHTLKEELLNNKIAKISEKNYYWLYEECMKLLKVKRHQIKAHEIGINNKRFNIKKGTPITINHLISLKLYTDFANTQRKFKKTCRKENRYETMQSLIKRNSECAQWCRYLKESCTFYGNLMAKKVILYTGLERQLLFSSMRQHFECPLSTTFDCNKAQTFCHDNGLILQLKAGNSKTRYFDVSWLSRFPEEQERLIMGSSLEISNIFINAKGSKKYISSLLMFEQLINGQFIDTNDEKEQRLYSSIAYIMKLEQEESMKDSPSEYNLALLDHMIKEMKQQYNNNALWINKGEISKIKYDKLKQLFSGIFFDHFKMEKSNINWVQQYLWKISDDNDDNNDDIYTEFKNMPPRKYILSPIFECIYKSEKIQFHLECCAKFSEESSKCALFLYINKLPKHIESIQIEYDILCEKESKHYQNMMMPQWLSNEKLYCGLQTFSSNCLNKNTSISWSIGLKIIDIRYY